MVHHLTGKGIPVLIVSQEMSELALGKRALQFLSEVPQDDWTFSVEKLREEADEHFEGRAEAYILETIPNAVQLCEKAIEMQKENGVRAVFIDYAQIVQGVGKTQYERVTDVSSKLRRLATESNLAIVVLAQLSREVEKRPEFHPTGKDLKDSGQIEQDADVVIFAVWPYKLDPKKERNHYQFLVEKNRNREIRKHGFDVFFEPERQRYLDKHLQTINEFAKDF
jgi:replicative DNA helicase